MSSRSDPSPGMQPDVICRAEDLPFADGSFDVVAARSRAHHFADVRAAVAEMARVAAGRRRRRQHALRSEARRGGRAAPRPVARPLLHRGRSGGDLRGGRPRVEEVRLVRAARSSSSRGSRAPAARARRPSASRELLADRTRTDGSRSTEDRCSRRGSLDGDHRRQRHEARRPGPHRAARVASTGCGTARYGTNVVAGVTPGKGGQDVEGVPVFDTVADAVDETGANTTMIFVPARFAADAIYEAVDAGIGDRDLHHRALPAHDMLRVYNVHPPARRDDARPELPGRRSRPARRTSGSSPPRSSARARSGSSPARARSPTRSATS